VLPEITQTCFYLWKIALAWTAGILVVSYTLALGVYRRRAP
jgi:hypothetical protein